MSEIIDEYMKQMISKTKNYTAVILKATEKIKGPRAGKIMWEHGRRNFQLREQGILSIVCPINDGRKVTGVGIFNRNPEEVKNIMDGDPGVIAGIFTYEIHLCSSLQAINCHE